MVTCRADTNSRCVHECEGEFCRAYYHHDEDRCFGTCDPDELKLGYFLAGQMAFQIGRSGWNSESSADLKGISGLEIMLAARTVKQLAESDFDKQFRDNENLSEVISISENIVGFTSPYGAEEEYFDIGWTSSNILSSMEAIQGAIRGQAVAF